MHFSVVSPGALQPGSWSAGLVWKSMRPSPSLSTSLTVTCEPAWTTISTGCPFTSSSTSAGPSSSVSTVTEASGSVTVYVPGDCSLITDALPSRRTSARGQGFAGDVQVPEQVVLGLDQEQPALTAGVGRLEDGEQRPEPVEQRCQVEPGAGPSQWDQRVGGEGRRAAQGLEGAQDQQRRERLQQMRAEIESLERQMAFKETREQKLRESIADYQGRIEAIPSIESDWVSLSRDYDTLQEAYRTLLAKSEDSKVAADLERQQIGEQFDLLVTDRGDGHDLDVDQAADQQP